MTRAHTLAALRLWLSLSCLLSLTSCDSNGTPGEIPPAPVRDGVLEDLASGVALGSYEALELRARSLADAAETLCAGPTAATLDATRDAWWAARESWKNSEIVHFGPAEDYPERLGPRIEGARPTNTTAIEEAVSSATTFDQAAFDGMGTATRGFGVIEYLMWGAGEDTLAGLVATPARCAFVAGAANDLASSTEQLADAWRAPWLERIARPTPNADTMYQVPQDVINEWVNRMAFTLENSRSMKFGAPAGDMSGGTPQPDTVESPYSARSLTDARDAFAGVRAVWAGGLNGGELGIVDLLRDDPDLVARVDGAFEVAEGWLMSVPEPLATTVTTDPASVVSTQEALRDLQVLIQVDVAQALGVTITFNDNDGD